MIKIQTLEERVKEDAFILLDRSQQDSYQTAYEILSMARKAGYHLITRFENGTYRMSISSRIYCGIEEIKQALSDETMKVKRNIEEVSERGSDFGRS